MPVDVVTSIEISRPRTEVAAFAGDPSNATRLAYTYELLDVAPDERLVMSTSQKAILER